MKDIEIAASSTDNTVKDYPGRTQTAGHNHANWIIYRLTDIMLLKAEALAELATEGSTEFDEAFKLVEAVYNRSLCEAYTSAQNKLSKPTKKDALRELVLKERQRELMFEGKRWYDLVRRSLRDGNTDVLSDAVNMKEMDGAGAAKQRLKKIDAIFWPYNLEEMRVNHNLVQNSAFSSGENTSFSKTSN
jgi:hypothetical protein